MNLATLNQVEQYWSRLCFDRNFKAKGRIKVYREMVYDRFLETVKNISPVARSFLSDAEWEKMLWDYLEHSPPAFEVLRDLPLELSRYLKKVRHPLQKKYPFLGELLEYEYLEIAMRFAAEDAGKTPRGQIRLNPAHVLAEYRWPVHFISEDFRDPKKLPQGRHHLLLWRRPDDLEVKFMEVNPLVASLVRLLEKSPCKPAALLAAVARKNGLKAGADFTKEGRSLLAGLREKKILL